MYTRGMIFLEEEKKKLYEESAFFKKYFLALQERYYSLKEKYQVGKLLEQDAVVNQFQYYLSQNFIPFEKNIYKSNCMCILGVRMNSEGRIADEKIEIVVYTKRVDIHYTLDYGFKKVLCMRNFLLQKNLFLNCIIPFGLTYQKRFERYKKKLKKFPRKYTACPKRTPRSSQAPLRRFANGNFRTLN